MKKSDIYNVFIAGVEHGKRYGFKFDLNAPGLIEVLSDVTKDYADQEKKTINLLGSVLNAGFNYGSNLSEDEPIAKELVLKIMFENLIAGKPYLLDDPTYYCIKEKIDELLSK